ncbi:hypothetical protein V2J09_008436 [Rumex salicifolius]
MEWRTCYLDLLLVPSGLGLIAIYHAWLWHQVRTRPLTTIIGINAAGRRFWVSAMMRDNEKKNILAVQTLRNTIMGATLMATTSILLCSGMAAILSSTYSIKKPLNDTVYGGHGEFIMAVKYVALLLIFLFSFLCHSLSIRFLNQVNFLINSPRRDPSNGADDQNDSEACVLATSPAYVAELLERGIVLSTVGNRLFYGALPLLLWIFGPVLVFLCSATLVPLLYNLDVVTGATSAGALTKKLRGMKVNESNESGGGGDHHFLSVS